MLTALLNQVLAVTCDNADNNRTMIDEMENLVPGFRGSTARVRCFGHVLNLVVKVSPASLSSTYSVVLTSRLQAIMSQFDREAAKRKNWKNGEAEDPELLALDDKPGEVIGEPPPVSDEDLEAAEEADPGREASDDQEIDSLDDDHPELVISQADVKFGRLAIEKVRTSSPIYYPRCADPAKPSSPDH